jgi:hypothetical protein
MTYGYWLDEARTHLCDGQLLLAGVGQHQPQHQLRALRTAGHARGEQRVGGVAGLQRLDGKCPSGSRTGTAAVPPVPNDPSRGWWP